MKYKLIGLLLGIGLLSSPIISEASDVFTDIEEGSWYYNPIKLLKEKGIINGFDSGEFKPDENISREEVAAMAYRLYTSDLDNISIEKPFTSYEDVDENSWAIEYIEYLTQNGILSGYGENLFFPGKNISREETAVIFDRILKKKGLCIKKDKNLFKDDEEIASWSRDSVYRLKFSNYI
ncbi:MAG: S-layer homology domain-containing protein, partial [Andreesenia angusta]|nr:S-layer homology domain-containing protein [Andreesenia angusta]